MVQKASEGISCKAVISIPIILTSTEPACYSRSCHQLLSARVLLRCSQNWAPCRVCRGQRETKWIFLLMYTADCHSWASSQNGCYSQSPSVDRRATGRAHHVVVNGVRIVLAGRAAGAAVDGRAGVRRRRLLGGVAEAVVGLCAAVLRTTYDLRDKTRPMAHAIRSAKPLEGTML